MFPAPRLGFLRLIGLLLCVMKLSKAFSVSGGKRLSLLRPGHRLVGNGLWMYQRRSISIITSTNLSVRHRIMNLSDLHVSMRANTKLFSSIERSKQLPLQPHIDLTPEETELFDTILRFVDETKLNTTVRVAGGWVRDKVLQLPSKFDIDIALENMTGVQFATQMQQWLESTKNARMLTFSVIEQNTEKSKHLETGRYQIRNLFRILYFTSYELKLYSDWKVW